jgi:superfamily II DNA or RNA helicase
MSFLLELPPPGIPAVTLRPYQREAVDAIHAKLDQHRSTLLILPTGCGKTVTFGWLAREYAEQGKRTLVLAHRGELITQAVEKLSHIGLVCEKEMASHDAFCQPDCHATIATVQTLQRNRLKRWPADHFDLIITDEAHHATAGSYAKIYEHFWKAKHVGVTATADRGDKINLGGVFESVAYEMLLWDAVHYHNPETNEIDPMLSRLSAVQVDTQIDLRSIRTTAGDFNQAELEAAIRPFIEVLANETKKAIGDRPTLVFTPDVGSAQAMASALASLGLKADYVHGADPRRDEKIAAFQRQEIKVLCNCALLTEGFDAPHVAAVVLCRPTKSRALYCQMVGRGTRLAPGKTDCLIVDFSWLVRKHDLVKPADLVTDPGMDKRTKEILDEIVGAHAEVDIMEAVKTAKDLKEKEDHEKEEARRIKLQVRERDFDCKRFKVEFVSCDEWLGVKVTPKVSKWVSTATEGQLSMMERFKIDAPAGISRDHASKLIQAAIERKDKGLATLKQMRLIHKKCPNLSREEIQGMKFTEASEIITAIAEREGWGKRA